MLEIPKQAAFAAGGPRKPLKTRLRAQFLRGCARFMDYEIRDTFDIGATDFWDMFFSDAYNEGLWPAIDVDWKPIKFERTGEGDAMRVIREQKLTPHRQAPKAIQKLVSGTISYIEKNEFEAAKQAMKTVTIPNFAADRVDNHGVFRIETRGPNSVERIWAGTCNAKIPLLGGQIEKYLVGEIRESYRKATAYTRDFIASR